MRFISASDLSIEPFVPLRLWRGGDLQTIRNRVSYIEPDLAGYTSQLIEIETIDNSGDRLLARVNAPLRKNSDAAVVLVHGLTGSEDSRNIRTSAAYFLNEGYTVARLNLRGAGPSANTCRNYYHAGRSDDLATALQRLSTKIGADGCYVMGVSLGGNMLLKYLAEVGTAGPVRAAVAISPPVDLRAAQQRIMHPRNALYHWYLMRAMKTALRPTAAEAFKEPLARVASVYDFDDQIVAPLNKFSGAPEYYARASALPLLEQVKVPALILHPRNDPWVPIEPLQSSAVRNQNLSVLIPDDGGHVGFHARDTVWPWHNRCALAFFRQH